MIPKVEPLSPAFASAKEEAIARAAGLVGAKGALNAGQIQKLYDKVLGAKPRIHEEIVALGFAFGHLLIDRGSGFEWVSVRDEWAQETCVAGTGRKAFCAPVHMMDLRLQKGERSDI